MGKLVIRDRSACHWSAGRKGHRRSENRDRAGIRSGDLVTRFSGKEVTSFDTLKRLVGERNPGDEVKIEGLRGDKALTFSVVLAAYSGNTGR